MVPIEGKLKYLFAVGFFTIGAIGGVFWLTYSHYSYSTKISAEAFNNLVKISEEKSQKINDYLEAIEKDVKILQESDEVKELLKKDLTFDESVIKVDVDERARIIIKEVENYIRAHPEMTLEDLQESFEFQKIAIQPVGKEGYGFLFDSQSLINYFHKESRRIGYDYNTMEETFPALWEMFKETSDKGFSEGFYYRDQPDGSTSYKYGRFVQISVKTADGISMSVGTTAYVNDYKTIEEDSEYLENINKEKNYHNLILISPEGYVTYMVEVMDGFGTNLGWEINYDSGLSGNYYKVKGTNNISFYGPIVRHYGDIYPSISAMAPVYEKGHLLGYIGLIDEMDKVFNIVKDIKNLRETGESYLVNSEKLLISPLRYYDFDIMVQPVNTENTEECLNDFEEAEEKGISVEEYDEFEIQERKGEVLEFLNYQGEIVLGKDAPISEPHWCLLIEINKQEVIGGPLNEFIKMRIYFSSLGVLLLTIIGFFIGNYFSKKYRREEVIKLFPCGVRRMFQPWYCRLMKGDCATYPSGKCGRVMKTRDFFVNLKLGYSIIVALIIAVGYFFLINLFFGRIIYPLVISGLLSFIVGFLMFSYGFRLKYSGSRKYLFLGAGMIILYHLIHIPMEQYFNTVRPFNVIYWVPTLILYVLGFLSLLNFLERNKK